MTAEQDKEDWYLDDVIPGNGDLLFGEFVHFDDNTAVVETLTDEEIYAEVNEDECNNDNIIEDIPTITKKNCSTISYRAYEVTQKKITDYFKK